MDEALSVDVTERGCQADGNVQQTGQIERLSLVLLDDPIQELTSRIFQNEERAPQMTSQCQRLSGPRGVELARQ